MFLLHLFIGPPLQNEFSEYLGEDSFIKSMGFLLRDFIYTAKQSQTDSGLTSIALMCDPHIVR